MCDCYMCAGTNDTYVVMNHGRKIVCNIVMMIVCGVTGRQPACKNLTPAVPRGSSGDPRGSQPKVE